ncbi:hypothetical protein DYB31_002742 [Aphanomyces astaci]|uniref:Uncharacterized protein n=1 Tax=Aphanomyces astaci TaxID=112090 RepID=A0A397FYT5_APHAT|nr:hypothetical protein DYB31_002742 [Aphanomyces astaci]
MMPKRGAPTKSRQPPRPSAAKASSHQKYRPQWNEYLTDSSTYQLNQDQKLQKRIQMLTKIPTEVSAPRQPLAPPTKAKLLNNVQLPSRKPAVPRANVAALPLASQDKRSLPRVNFDDELRAFARESTSSVAAAETQKQHLQKELDRMDVMLASLELQADEISGVMEPRSLEAASSPDSNPDNNSTVDMTDTTFHHHEDNDQDDSVLATPSPTVAPTSPIDHDVVDLLHQDVMQSHAHLRDDFNRAVKHIVKLKAVVVNLRHTVHDVEDMMAAASVPSPAANMQKTQPSLTTPMMPSRHTDDVRRRESVSIRHAMRT